MKQTFAVIGAIGMVAAIGAVMAPRAMSAVIATLVRDVDNPARDSFQATVLGSSCDGSPLVCTGGLTVPATNGAGAAVSMLVIEHVSGVCPSQTTMALTNYPASQIVSAASITGVTSTSGLFVHVFPSVSANSGFSQTTRIYAAPGSTLVSVTPCNFFVSGYLVTP
jgi:hypothetical protein